jgi:hypothetical protein
MQTNRSLGTNKFLHFVNFSVLKKITNVHNVPGTESVSVLMGRTGRHLLLSWVRQKELTSVTGPIHVAEVY